MSRSAFHLLAALPLLLASPGRADDFQRLAVSMDVNGQRPGDALVIQRGDQLFVEEASLVRARLLPEVCRAAAETFDGSSFVRLGALAPGVTYVFDEDSGVLHVSAAPEVMRANVFDLSALSRPQVEPRADLSAFANYALRYAASSPSAFGEIGGAYGPAALQTAFGITREWGFVRGLTAFTLQDVPRRQRIVVGDAFVSSGEAFGGSAYVAGVHVGTDFGMQPGFSPAPSFSQMGAVQSPSTLTLYENGVPVRRMDVPPGDFRLDTLPIQTGLNASRVVLRDALGRETDLQRSIYLGRRQLAPGVSDYGYSLGLQRSAVDSSNGSYGGWVLLAHHRIGITPSWTAGCNLEAAGGVVSAGLSSDLSSLAGESQVGIAGSTSGLGQGAAITIAHSYLTPRYSLAAYGRVMSPGFANVALRPEDDRPALDLGLGGGLAVNSILSLSSQLTYARTRDAGDRYRAALGIGIRIGNTTNLAANVAYAKGPLLPPGFEGFGILSISLDGGHLVSVQAQSSGSGDTQALVGASKEVPTIGEGFGYNVQLSSTKSSMGSVTYQGSFLRATGGLDFANGDLRPAASVEGSVVAIGGKVFATRLIQGGFALMRLPGVADARASVNDIEIGRTDRDGDIVIPTISPFQPNQLSVMDSDLPDGVALGESRKSVAVYPRAGAIVRFETVVIRAVRGRIAISRGGKIITPEYGEIQILGDKPASSPIGSSGAFEFDRVEPGVHEALIVFEGGQCRFRLTFPDNGQEPIIDIGEVQCAM